MTKSHLGCPKLCSQCCESFRVRVPPILNESAGLITGKPSEKFAPVQCAGRVNSGLPNFVSRSKHGGVFIRKSARSAPARSARF